MDITRSELAAHDIQNEILENMAHTVLHKITENILSNKYYSTTVDEATDVSFKEQVSICIRHVSADMDIHEDFLGLDEIGSTTAEVSTTIIKGFISFWT